MYSFRDKQEEAIAVKLVDAVLANGDRISVYDGEAYPVKFSSDREEILTAMASTDMDTLVIRKPDHFRLGSVLLIYGNGEDLISDHTANEHMDKLCSQI